MNDLIRIIRDFLYRDLAFILGGIIVIGSIAYLVGWLPLFNLKSLPAWSLFLIPAMAYVVGYAVQDIGGVIGITYTGYVLNPNRFCCWLYRRFSRAPWTAITIDLQPRFAHELHMGRLDIPQVTRRSFERILDLKVISMCVGGCLLLSSILLLGSWLFALLSPWLFALLSPWRFALPPTKPDGVALGLGILFFLFGASLICLGWIKAMQQMQFLQAIDKQGYPLLPSQRS
jgi:hypothetical protein